MGDFLGENSMISDLWKNTGSCIASFHMKGFYHHDLNIENILIDSDQNVFLLDFDKAFKWILVKYGSEEYQSGSTITQ
ncbi:MAG: hypothetical protein Ct9H300mP6_19040 [Gammaproteobacteria bacterium]|nr:MAG: hypothetical protein Ct9H300mP6_19040 [Gammaproteobacteria bacterium]